VVELSESEADEVAEDLDLEMEDQTVIASRISCQILDSSLR
jgi:hypothetical protein